MARQAKLIITSEDKSAAGIQSAIKNILGIDDAAKKIEKALAAAFTVTGIYEAGKKLAEFGADCVETFGDVDRSMTQLKTALGGSETSFGRMTSLIDSMSRKTLSSKDELEKLVAELASLGRSDSDIERITQASVALSNVTGDSLNAAFTKINATFSGTGGKLEKLVPEIGNLSKSQLEAGDAVDLLNKKFGAISDSMAGGITQQMKNLKDSQNALKEAMGANLAPVFEPMVGWIKSLVDNWADVIEKTNQYRTALTQVSSENDVVRISSQLTIAQKKYDDLQAELKSRLQEAGVINLHTYQATTGDYSAKSSEKWMAELTKISANFSSNSGMPALRGSIDTLSKDLEAAKAKASSAAVRPGASTDNAAAPIEWGSDAWKASGNDQGIRNVQPWQIPVTGTLPAAVDNSGSAAASGLFSGLGDILAPLKAAFSPLVSMFTSLESVSAILHPLQTIFESMMDVLGPLINQALAPIVGCLKIVGKILAAVLVPVLNILTPIIDALAEVFVWFMNKIMIPVGNFIIDIWNGVAWALNQALGWLGVNIAYASHIAAVSMADATAAGQSSDTSSSSGGSASYTGAASYTFNFYNQGNVVGSGGLEELAYIIRDILKKDERYA